METEQIFNEENEKTTDIVKCPSCGSNMIFDIEKQLLYCEHCTTEIDFTKNQNVTENDWSTRDCNHEKWSGETHVVQCNNCGSREIIEDSQIAIECPFCGTTNVVKIDELPGIKPTAVFPFTVTKENSVLASQKWLKKKWYVPNDCKRSANLKNINGVYMPSWTFDSDTRTQYHGVLGKRYTRTVGSGKDRRTVTEIRYFNVNGVYEEFFDDVFIVASKEINQTIFNNIRPFNKDVAVVYDRKYLSGFVANHYEIGIEDSFEKAKDLMNETIKSKIVAHYNADVVQSLNLNTYHSNIKFKYVLLPVWVGNYKYKDKQYNYYINGNTSRVYGKAPISPIKATLAVLGGLVIVGGIIAGVYYATDGFEGAEINFTSQIEENITEEQVYEIPGYKFKY